MSENIRESKKKKNKERYLSGNLLTLLSLLFRKFCVQQYKAVVLGEIPGVQEEGEATGSQSCVERLMFFEHSLFGIY